MSEVWYELECACDDGTDDWCRDSTDTFSTILRAQAALRPIQGLKQRVIMVTVTRTVVLE